MASERIAGASATTVLVGLAAFAAVSCAQIIGADWDSYARSAGGGGGGGGGGGTGSMDETGGNAGAAGAQGEGGLGGGVS